MTTDSNDSLEAVLYQQSLGEGDTSIFDQKDAFMALFSDRPFDGLAFYRDVGHFTCGIVPGGEAEYRYHEKVIGWNETPPPKPPMGRLEIVMLD